MKIYIKFKLLMLLVFFSLIMQAQFINGDFEDLTFFNNCNVPGGGNTPIINIANTPNCLVVNWERSHGSPHMEDHNNIDPINFTDWLYMGAQTNILGDYQGEGVFTNININQNDPTKFSFRVKSTGSYIIMATNGLTQGATLRSDIVPTGVTGQVIYNGTSTNYIWQTEYVDFNSVNLTQDYTQLWIYPMPTNALDTVQMGIDDFVVDCCPDSRTYSNANTVANFTSVENFIIAGNSTTAQGNEDVEFQVGNGGYIKLQSEFNSKPLNSNKFHAKIVESCSGFLNTPYSSAGPDQNCSLGCSLGGTTEPGAIYTWSVFSNSSCLTDQDALNLLSCTNCANPYIQPGTLPCASGIVYALNVTGECGDISQDLIKITFYYSRPTNDNNENKAFLRSPLVNAYPNPTTGLVTIQYELEDREKEAKVVITDMLGGNVIKEVLINQDEQGNRVQIDLSNQKSGMYFYSLYIDEQIVKTKKLVIQK